MGFTVELDLSAHLRLSTGEQEKALKQKDIRFKFEIVRKREKAVNFFSFLFFSGEGGIVCFVFCFVLSYF